MIVIVLREIFLINLEKVCIMSYVLKLRNALSSRKVEITSLCEVRNGHAIHRKLNLRLIIVLRIRYHDRCAAAPETRMTFDVGGENNEPRIARFFGTKRRIAALSSRPDPGFCA